jgi:mRNA interferase MazF
VIQRGEIWWADLGDPSGSGPAGNRPVLVVQADAFNRSRLGTVIVAVVTSNLALAEAPGNVLLRQDRRPGCSATPSSMSASSSRSTSGRSPSGLAVLSFGLQQHVDDGVRLALGL